MTFESACEHYAGMWSLTTQSHVSDHLVNIKSSIHSWCPVPPKGKYIVLKLLYSAAACKICLNEHNAGEALKLWAGNPKQWDQRWWKPSMKRTDDNSLWVCCYQWSFPDYTFYSVNKLICNICLCGYLNLSCTTRFELCSDTAAGPWWPPACRCAWRCRGS